METKTKGIIIELLLGVLGINKNTLGIITALVLYGPYFIDYASIS